MKIKTAGTLVFEDMGKRVDIYTKRDEAIRGTLVGIEYLTSDKYSNAAGELMLVTRKVQLIIEVLHSEIVIEADPDLIIHIQEDN